MNRKNKNAFTLVELIIVISIIAILSTIGFINFKSYTSNSRDSLRISDVWNAKKWLELFYTKVWLYPNPEEPLKIVIYSWSEIFNEWILSNIISKQIKLNKEIKDPLYNKYYTYSIINTKKQYQIWYIKENIISYNNPFVNKIYAWDIISWIEWNYSGSILVSSWSETLEFTSPSIITENTSTWLVDTTDLEWDFINNWSSSLPFSYLSETNGWLENPQTPQQNQVIIDFSWESPVIICENCISY